MNTKKNVLLATAAAPSQTPFSTYEKRPPIGVGFLITILKNSGHKVFFIDNYLQPDDFLENNFLEKNEIDYIGIYASTICYRDTLRMLHKIEYLRRSGQWQGKIMLGGPHTTVALNTIPSFVDYVVQGEGERAIIDIVEDKVKERVVRYPRIDDLDSLPMPAWDVFAKLPYIWDVQWFPEKPVFTMTTSRGCPFNCAFCSVNAVWGKKYTYFSAKRIVEDIEHLVKTYGAKGIYFREDNFTLNRKRVIEFCNILLDRGIDLRWACESRVDNLDRELLKLMYRAGARGLYFGVESGSQKMLDFINKGTTVPMIKSTFALCNEIGFKTAASIVVGLPKETEDDLAKTQNLLDEIKPTVTWYNVFVGIPNSRLYNYVLNNNLYEFIDDRGLVYLKGHNERVERFYNNRWDAGIPVKLEKPSISAIMAVFNAENYVDLSIRSILGQTKQDFELIVVDDGSTDDTFLKINRFKDPRIKVLRNDKNIGPANSRNKALRMAKGKYVAIMDADDVSLPHRFETELNYLERNPDVHLVGSSFYEIDQEGKIQKIVKVLTESNALKENLLKQNWFGHSTVMIRKDSIQSLGGYDETYRYSHDYELFLRMSEKYALANIEEPLCCYRVTDKNISTAKSVEQRNYAIKAILEAKKRRRLFAIANGNSLVSVIVPTFNRPNFLLRALESLTTQTHKPIEIIVVNDAGLDVIKILKPFARNLSIKYICHDSNRGLAAARNSGLKVSIGKYITYLDDDDIYYPKHIETLVKFLQATNYKVAYTDAYRAWEVPSDGGYIVTKKDVPYSYDFDYQYILKGNFIPVLCVMHDKECIDTVGYFDETLKCHEDWDLWMRMSRVYTFAHLKKVTCEFSWRQDGTTMTLRNKADMDSTYQIVAKRGEHYRSQGCYKRVLRMNDTANRVIHT